MKIKKLFYVVIFSWFLGMFTAASAQEGLGKLQYNFMYVCMYVCMYTTCAS